MKNILHINSSARSKESRTRLMTQMVVEQLKIRYPNNAVVSRDVAKGQHFVDEQWIMANFTPADQRSAEQINKLKYSDELLNELQMAQHIVIGAPIYNFSIPATLKAWIDMVARVGVSFKYTGKGAEGLLKGKNVYIAIASGGTSLGSKIDFSSNYLKHMLSNFFGMNIVSIIDINQFNLDLDDRHKTNLKTKQEIDKLIV